MIRQQHISKPVANYNTTMKFMKKHFPGEDPRTIKIISDELRDFAINEEYSEDQISGKTCQILKLE